MLTTETTATDAVLDHSRLVAQHNMLATEYADIPEKNRDIYYQVLALVSAAKVAVLAIVDNSFEGAPLPYSRINHLRSQIIEMASEVGIIQASRL